MREGLRPDPASLHCLSLSGRIIPTRRRRYSDNTVTSEHPLLQTPDTQGIRDAFPAWAAAWDRAEYLAIHGSEAYGLAMHDSDLDLKGVSIPRRDDVLGYRDLPPEQLEFSPDATTPGRLPGPYDSVIFSLQKLCRLGAACNPNVVEMLSWRSGTF